MDAAFAFSFKCTSATDSQLGLPMTGWMVGCGKDSRIFSDVLDVIVNCYMQCYLELTNSYRALFCCRKERLARERWFRSERALRAGEEVKVSCITCVATLVTGKDVLN